MPARHLGLGSQEKPVETVGRQGQQKIQLADGRKGVAAQHFHRHLAGKVRQVKLRRLGGARDIGDTQNDFALAIRPGVFAGVGQNPAVGRRKHFQAAATERFLLLAHRQQATGPVQQRMGIAGLGLDIDRRITIERVHDRRQHQAGRIGTGETAIAVDRPLHRRAHAIAVAQVDIVAHADFIAVIQGRCARHRQQQAVEQLDPPTVTLHQRRQTSANTQIDPGAAVGGIVIP